MREWAQATEVFDQCHALVTLAGVVDPLHYKACMTTFIRQDCAGLTGLHMSDFCLLLLQGQQLLQQRMLELMPCCLHLPELPSLHRFWCC